LDYNELCVARGEIVETESRFANRVAMTATDVLTVINHNRNPIE
jgi:hypothetical protein